MASAGLTCPPRKDLRTMRVLRTAGRATLPVVAAMFAVGLVSAPAWASVPARPGPVRRPRSGFGSRSAATTVGTLSGTGGTTTVGIASVAAGTAATRVTESSLNKSGRGPHGARPEISSVDRIRPVPAGSVVSGEWSYRTTRHSRLPGIRQLDRHVDDHVLLAAHEPSAPQLAQDLGVAPVALGGAVGVQQERGVDARASPARSRGGPPPAGRCRIGRTTSSATSIIFST